MAQTASPILELQRQQLLLKMEYEEEKEAFRQLTEKIGLERRVRRGDAWWPVVAGRSYYNSMNQLVVELTRPAPTDDDDALPDHNFEFGKHVQFFRVAAASSHVSSLGSASPASSASPAGSASPVSSASLAGSGLPAAVSYFPFMGTVSYADQQRMVVAIPDGSPVIDLQQAESLGVGLSFDETSYRTMIDALNRTMRAKGRLGYLRDLFYTTQRAETFTFAPIHFPYLNVTQEEAVNSVLRAKDVAVVHGPPGTGKTTTLVEAIRETLMRESQVLVCAQSNMAVDWISEKLLDRGISVLRIGNPTRVTDRLLAYTYERRFEAHPDYPQLWALRKAIRELRSHRHRVTDGYHQKMDRLKSRATELEIRINAELFGEARVVAATLVGSAHRLLDGMKFGTLFIDEAAQALEAACWIPIRRASRVIFAGDHCQLPPTIKCYEALKGGLGKTLMERIVENKPGVVTLLRVQYRMNEEIMRFSSDWFYGNRVVAAPEVKYRSILDLDLAMEWVNSSTSPASLASSTSPASLAGSGLPAAIEQHTANQSLVNPAEAELTLQTLENYFTKIGKERILDERLDVGIISPYRAQVDHLRRLLKRREFFKPYRHLITVNTVDGFQGQERDIIVISLVRANDEGQIGFLRDLRRMNVAITRARMKVIIVGNPATMTRHPFYRKLYQYVEALRQP